jgi:succinyl-diaminopimelate desuccinylase
MIKDNLRSSEEKMDHDKIKSFIGGFHQEMVDILSDLVAIPTVNPPGKSYRQCVDYLTRLLKEWRIDHDVIQVTKGKYPRLCILGSVGEGEVGLHLHGHYDVVPAYSAEQFKPEVQGDVLYGRGSSDMKSGLVAVLYTLKFFQKSGIKPDGRISFSFVPDEESGSRWGTQHLCLTGLLPQPSLGMLMPEPTSGVIWNANKGALSYRVVLMGKSAHVALEHQGKNAFEAMVDLVQSLVKLKKIINSRKTSCPVVSPQSARSVMLIGGESGSGVNFNVVPDKAYFTIDRRLNPEEKLTEAKKELMEIFLEARRRGIGIETELLQEGEPSSADTGSPLAVALKDSVAEVKGRIPAFVLCPGVCEIRFFNKQGIPAYAYGPGLLEVSHGPEEYVKIPDLLDCTEIFVRTVFRLLG